MSNSSYNDRSGLRFAVLGSSSSGNALLVCSQTTNLLVDNGFSFKRLSESLSRFNLTPEDIDAVLVTHEHADHVKGIGTLARRTGLPVYMTYGCAEALPVGVGDIPNLRCFESGADLQFGDTTVISFSVSHDAADPVNYIFRVNGTQLGLATDCGHFSHLVRARLAGSHALVLESNHCPEMLRRGPYPPQIQQRIHGRTGHLSNHDVQKLLREVYHEALQLVVLTHISRENNTPELALKFAREALGDAVVHLVAAPPDDVSPLFEVGPP